MISVKAVYSRRRVYGGGNPNWLRALHTAFCQLPSDPAPGVSQKTRDDYLALFLAEFGKVRVPTGEGKTITEALTSVSRLSRSKLPMIPKMAGAPESWRRIAALRRDLPHRSANGIYFLTCRDTAKAFPGLSHQAAYNINLALAQLGVVEIVDRGDARSNGERASQFWYLLPQTQDVAEEDDGGIEL